MSDHCEEQEMEAEALTAIFDDCLEIVHASQPFEWAIRLWPEQHSPEENHVGIKLIAKIPLDYPEISLPELDIELLKGLTEDHRQDLLVMAKEEAEANMGLPSIFAVCERLREWLAENNVKGMDDVSMYAQMMRREKEKEKVTHKSHLEFESQKKEDGLTEAEAEELAVRKRRAEGTPVTEETFTTWKAKFEAEMKEQREREEADATADSKKKRDKVVDKTGRLTGHEQFSDQTGTFNLEAFEAAAENAQRDEDEEDDDLAENVNEELFDVDDDDLDDLDFDDDDDDEEDDESEEEPDI